MNVRVASQVAKRFKTKEIRNLGNFKKISEMPGFYGEYPAANPKAMFFGKKLQKVSCKIFHRKTYLV